MDILLLTTPTQHSKINSSVELNIKQLKNWVDKLSLDNVFLVVKSLQNKIEAFNEIQLNDASRLKLLEVYWDALESITFLYDNKRLDMLPIKQQEKNLLAEDIMWLYMTLANGYKTIIINSFNRNINPKNDHVLQTSLLRAFELLIQAAIYAYCGHKSVPPLVYLEINQIYSYMESFKCLDLKIKTRNTQNSINSLYKQFMFISIIDPYCINEDDIFLSQYVLNNFLKHIEIKIDENCTSSNGWYLVDLNEDNSPISCGKVSNRRLLPSVRLININKILKMISSWVDEKKSTKIDAFELSDIQILERLLSIFNSDRIRIEKRASINKDVRVAIGIKSISYFLSSIDNILKEYSDKTPTQFNKDKFTLQKWILKDECNQGRKLSIPCDNLNNSIPIGELVGIIDTMKSDSGFHPVIVIGIIRWKRNVDNNLNIGVEIIPGNPRYANRIVSNDTKILHPGIYIPAEDILSRPPALVIEKEAYQEKKLLNVTIKDKTQLIQMGVIFTESPLYVQCEFCISNA
ncbi:MAG: hypothetical protein ACC657_05355 [Thiohalomonadales bacterium]